MSASLPAPGNRCPTCGGPLTTENYVEATITFGKCGYSWAGHFGGGEIQTEPCKAAPALARHVYDTRQAT